MPPQGLELFSHAKGKTNIPGLGGATGGAIVDAMEPFDPDLAVVIEQWPGLSEAVKAQIVALVRQPIEEAE